MGKGVEEPPPHTHTLSLTASRRRDKGAVGEEMGQPLVLYVLYTVIGGGTHAALFLMAQYEN